MHYYYYYKFFLVLEWFRNRVPSSSRLRLTNGKRHLNCASGSQHNLPLNLHAARNARLKTL